jgi:hypothetical protein
LIRGPAAYGNDGAPSKIKNNADLCEEPRLGAYATKTIYQGKYPFLKLKV